MSAGACAAAINRDGPGTHAAAAGRATVSPESHPFPSLPSTLDTFSPTLECKSSFFKMVSPFFLDSKLFVQSEKFYFVALTHTDNNLSQQISTTPCPLARLFSTV